MSNKHPSPISAHNFHEAWEFVSQKLHHAKYGYAIDRVADPIGHLSFLVPFLFCTCGIAYTHVPLPAFPAFFQNSKFFTDCWQSFSAFAFSGSENMVHQIGVCLLICWGISFTVTLITAGIVRFSYHPELPEEPKFPKETENARMLMETVHTIERTLSKPRAQGGGKCMILYTLLMGALASMYIIHCVQVNIMDARALFTDAMFYVYVFCATMIIMISYTIANYPLTVLLRQICRTKIPKGLFGDAEAYLKYAALVEHEPVEAPAPATEESTDAQV